jgi:SAM-dependent methyltransferase
VAGEHHGRSVLSEPGYYAHLDFNAPLSDVRADAIAAALARRAPATVLDIGCGWAELLLRVLSAAPEARGSGIDSDERLIARGRANAAARGLSDRVDLVAGDAAAAADPADVILNIGAEHVYGDQQAALGRLASLVRPGGVVLFGSGFWQRSPTVAQAAALGATPDDQRDLAGLVELAIGAGLRPLEIQTANEDEWNAFESGYLADWEKWLAGNADDPAAPARRADADRHRTGWLRGYRGVLGFAYLTLAAPA